MMPHVRLQFRALCLTPPPSTIHLPFKALQPALENVSRTNLTDVKCRLTLKPHARSLGIMGGSTGPVMMYEVKGLPEGQRVSIANFRTEEQVPVWQIGGHVIGKPVKWTGAFKSPEDALAQLQREIDSDTADSRFWSSSSIPSG